MDATQRLLELRDIERRLETMLLESEPPSTCELCGNPLICAHCVGKKGGQKAALMTTREQRQRNGRKGGRPYKTGERPRKQMVQDPVTGVSVPTPEAKSASGAEHLGIDPTKYYKPEEVAQFVAVDPETLRHWRGKRKGPAYIKLEGHFVRYSGRAVLDWLADRSILPAIKP